MRGFNFESFESKRLRKEYNLPKEIEYWNFSDFRDPLHSKKYIIKIKPSMRNFDFEKGSEQRLYVNIELNEIIGVKYKNKIHWNQPEELIEYPKLGLIFSEEFPLTKDHPVRNILYNIHEKYDLEKEFIQELFEPSICNLLNYRKRIIDPKSIENCCKNK